MDKKKVAMILASVPWGDKLWLRINDFNTYDLKEAKKVKELIEKLGLHNEYMTFDLAYKKLKEQQKGYPSGTHPYKALGKQKTQLKKEWFQLITWHKFKDDFYDVGNVL